MFKCNVANLNAPEICSCFGLLLSFRVVPSGFHIFAQFCVCPVGVVLTGASYDIGFSS